MRTVSLTKSKSRKRFALRESTDERRELLHCSIIAKRNGTLRMSRNVGLTAAAADDRRT
jgi:hypothetical protein